MKYSSTEDWTTCCENKVYSRYSLGLCFLVMNSPWPAYEIWGHMPIPSYSIIDYNLLLKFGSIKNPPTIMSYFSPFYMTSMTSIFLNPNSSPQIFILLLISLEFCMHSSKQSIPSIFLGDLLNYWANIQMAKARYPWPVPMSRILGLGLSLSWG